MKTTQSPQNQPLRGGGLPKQEIIRLRCKQFVRRKNGREINKLQPPIRGAVAWCLSRRCGLTHEEIAEFLGVALSTIKRDISQADLYYFRVNQTKSYIDSLFSYILYNAKYVQ